MRTPQIDRKSIFTINGKKKQINKKIRERNVSTCPTTPKKCKQIKKLYEKSLLNQNSLHGVAKKQLSKIGKKRMKKYYTKYINKFTQLPSKDITRVIKKINSLPTKKRSLWIEQCLDHNPEKLKCSFIKKDLQECQTDDFFIINFEK